MSNTDSSKADLQPLPSLIPKNMHAPTLETLVSAAGCLGKSERGSQALKDLLVFLENGACGLDSDNQVAVATLLLGAWGSHAGSTREIIQKEIAS